MHRHAVEYSTYPRGPRSGPGCSVPRRTQILLRNVPSSGTVSRLNQRLRARRSATISDRRSVCPWPAHCHRGAPRWPWYRCWPPPTFHRFRSPNGRYKADMMKKQPRIPANLQPWIDDMLSDGLTNRCPCQLERISSWSWYALRPVVEPKMARP
jgi:hypothetical protein